MTVRSFQIAIAAETIPSIECGLGYFLYNAVRRLASAQPSWKFMIVACSTFKQLVEIDMPNIEVIVWDAGNLQRTVTGIWRRLAPDLDAGELNFRVGQYIPFQSVRAKLGSIRDLWNSLQEVDVIWTPHFAIESHRLSLFRNLSTIESPILFTIHDIHPVFFPDDWRPDSLDRFWHEFVPFAQRSHFIVTHTEFQRKSITEHLRIDPTKIGVTPCPSLIDPEVLLRRRDAVEAQAVLTGMNIPGTYVLYPASTSHTHKNHTRLLLAWAKLKSRLGSQCPTLVCTARGHLWPALNALIEALELEGTVIFAGRIETDVLSVLYQNCTAVIVPTLYEGGGSGPVAEACLVGKPVICSMIPQIEEQLQAYGGCEAIFVEPESVEAITQAVESMLTAIPELEAVARKNQQLLVQRVPTLWDQWASFYAEQFQNLAVARRHRTYGGFRVA